MTNIRYICLSDLHLGQSDSLLTALSRDDSGIDVTTSSPALTALGDVLRAIRGINGPHAKPPTLILNGDILETALAEMNIATMVFERFLEEILPENGEHTCDRIIYLPGNHDHHFWEMARESAYLSYIENCPPGSLIGTPWHASNLFIDRARRKVTSGFLRIVLDRYPHLRSFPVDLAYPNLGILSPDKHRVAYFHHGHYTESIYRLMTDTGNALFPERRGPTTVWELEAENFAWIDFFWSTMGRSGNVGPLVQRVYNCLGDEAARNRRIKTAVNHAIARVNPVGPNILWEEGVTHMVSRSVDRLVQQEKQQTGGGPLSPECNEGMHLWVSAFLRAQADIEIAAPPQDAVFVFGHTHKPFERMESFDGFDRRVRVYNTGGWVVETETDSPATGASIVVLDENLASAAIHLYNEGNYRISVSAPDGEDDNELAHHLRRAIKSDPAFETFAQTMSVEVKRRQGFLAARLAEA